MQIIRDGNNKTQYKWDNKEVKVRQLKLIWVWIYDTIDKKKHYVNFNLN